LENVNARLITLPNYVSENMSVHGAETTLIRVTNTKSENVEKRKTMEIDSQAGGRN